ncbi:MAG: carboxypeptidase regulatory-like domain-containing protein [Prevotella sp.]|nr:carboxypeptidase regulatory-like domain-containing protein [Prevotella sp.]
MKKYTLLFFFLAAVLGISAQSRTTQLTIKVTSVEGDQLEGQPVTLTQTDYQVSYGTLKLDAQGVCSLKVYSGGHHLSVERDGFQSLDYDFTIANEETEKTVSVSLTEKTRTPFALQATVDHDVFTGKNSVSLSWNKEAPAFFDDFESYDPFAISFGEWTGIDADEEAAAPLLGTYPNRGVLQYAQIINPLTVTPTWWYDYPILRPYSGQQYVGFTRTNTGNQNDDWLISPVVTPGTDNVLTFMGKAADQFPERFMVYVTEKTDAPAPADFVRLDQGNYESADYTGWRKYSYDLSQYAGKPIKFAIRYINSYNLYRSFMLMIDDVYVGQPQEYEGRGAYGANGTNATYGARASRVQRPSPANPNESFNIYLDGAKVGSTDGYDYVISDVAGGNHTVGVQASYIAAQSEPTTVNVNIPADGFARVVFRVTANSILTADGQKIVVTSLATTESYELTVADGQAVLPSLPHGQYLVNVAAGAFTEWTETITVDSDATIDVTLDDQMLAPYNITADVNDEGLYVLRWNQELIFKDSFEEYEDFSVGQFGDWFTIDRDQMPVYPISLNNAIIAFPGSGSATNPTAIAPMVFNPWHTTPAMMPTDQAIGAPTGDKTVIFFSAQQAKNDKWLISPLLSIHDAYKLTVTAKGYSAAYPESMEFCVSVDGSTNPNDFVVLSNANPLSADEWTIYQTDLDDYAGMDVRLAVHYTSTDAFMAQVDDFTVGPENGQGETVDYGNVVRFDIFIDGEKVGQSTSPTFTLPQLAAGTHTVGIKAIYKGGESELTEYVVSVTAIDPVGMQTQQTGLARYYTLQGQQVSHPVQGGVYLMRQNGRTIKIRK